MSSFDASPQCDFTTDLTRQNNKSPSALLAQAISAKLEDGNLKAATRLLCSDDSPADPPPDTLQKLQKSTRLHQMGSLTCLPLREILL